MLLIKIGLVLTWLGFGGLFWHGVEMDTKIHKHFSKDLNVEYSKSTAIYCLIYVIGVVPVALVLLIL